MHWRYNYRKHQALPFLDRSLAALPGAKTGLLNRIGVSEISENGPDAIKRMLAAVREHMGMEIAYFSQFVSKSARQTVVFRGVDAPGFEQLLSVGDCKVRDDTYCHHVLNGNLPGVMMDTTLYPRAQSLLVTQSMPIRAFIGVPIYLRDGSVYGMLCCSSPYANPTLTNRDTQVMRVFADMVGQQLNRDLSIEKDLSEVSARIERVIKRDEFKFAYQPILTLAPLRLEGVEALCRFAPVPYRSPDQWFGEAARVGLGVELELATVRMALRAFGAIPANLFMSVNVSPETALNGAFIQQFRDCPKSRLVLEITEHARVDDYGALLAALAPLRAEGVRLSIDDAGAGFASLKHILNLNPDIVKLDIALTKAIDMDPARRALATALVYFAKETQSQIIAEGVETESELATLRGLGIPMGQGYLLGRPADLASNKILCEMEAKRQAFEVKLAPKATLNGASPSGRLESCSLQVDGEGPAIAEVEPELAAKPQSAHEHRSDATDVQVPDHGCMVPSRTVLLGIIEAQTEVVKLALDLIGVMNLVAERVQKLTNASGAVVEMAEGEDMVYRAASGHAAPQLGLRLKRRGSLSGLCVASDTILCCVDSENDPRVDREACRRVGLRSMVVVPLRHLDHAVGVLKVIAPGADAFSDADVRVLALMSGLIAAAMFHATQYEINDLYIRATRDALTGLPNRALFYDRLRQALFIAQRDGSLLGILNLDLDRFKRINDKLGHRAGDAAISEAGRRMSQASRRSDTVARVGGDEFAVILPGLRSRRDALMMSERIEASVSKPFDFEGHQIDLKVSIGIAMCPEDGQDMTALLDLADRSMYAVRQARKAAVPALAPS